MSNYSIQFTNKNLLTDIKSYLSNVPSYVIVSGDMGSIIIIRRLSINHPLEELVMDYDSWYNDTLMNEYKLFINGFTQACHPTIVNQL